jgi:hypothetical protein
MYDDLYTDKSLLFHGLHFAAGRMLLICVFLHLLQPAEEAEMIKAEEDRLRHTFDVRHITSVGMNHFVAVT